MLCDEVRPMLIRHLEGRLRADEEQCFERHLEQCNMCQEALEIQQRVAEVLSSRPVVRTPLGFSDRVMANLSVQGWLAVLDWRAWTFRLAPVAAGLTVVAVLGFGSTEVESPIELSEVVAEWTIDDNSVVLPAFSLLWQEGVTSDTLLEVVLTADPEDPLSY